MLGIPRSAAVQGMAMVIGSRRKAPLIQLSVGGQAATTHQSPTAYGQDKAANWSALHACRWLPTTMAGAGPP